MKKIYLSLATLVVVSLMLTGCATLLGGGAQQNVSVKADRPEVSFLIKDQTGSVVFEGKNPGTLTLAKKNTYTIEVSGAGFATQTISISQGINGWFFGNICFGGIPGGLVDFLTGSMWELQPSSISIKMRAAMTETSDGFLVSFYTRGDDGVLRSIDIPLTRI